MPMALLEPLSEKGAPPLFLPPLFALLKVNAKMLNLRPRSQRKQRKTAGVGNRTASLGAKKPQMGRTSRTLRTWFPAQLSLLPFPPRLPELRRS